MDSRPTFDAPLAATRRLRAAVRRTVADTPTDALATGVVGFSSLLAAFVGFVVTSPLSSTFLFVAVVAACYGWVRHRERTVKAVTATTTASTIVVLGLVTAFVFVEAWPTVEYASVEVSGIAVPGLRLFVGTRFSAVAPPIRYSMVPMIQGTVLVTLVATAVAGPLGVAAALFVSEIAPPGVRETVKPAVEILAGIPSIVYGFLGFTILSPWASEQFALVGQGTYLFVGVVVGLMALPTVVSVAEDALNSVPESTKSGSLALGTTEWQTVTSITVPAAFSGVSAAVLLGVGRAIGETMAATVMLRKSSQMADPLYNVFYGYQTLTSLIAANYGEATGLQFHALFVAGAILFVTVLVLSLGSQYVEARTRGKFGGER